MQKRGDRGVTSIFSGTKVYNLRSDLKSQIKFVITLKICYVTPLKYPQAAAIRDQKGGIARTAYLGQYIFIKTSEISHKLRSEI